MKLTRIVCLITVIFAAVFMAGCTEEKKIDEGDVVQVVNVKQINEDLGIEVKLPAEIKNEECSVIKGTIGQIEFNFDGVEYIYRVEKKDNETDLSDYSDETQKTFTYLDTDLVGETPFTIKDDTAGIVVSVWYNEKAGTANTIFTKANGSMDGIKEITTKFISVQ